MTPVAVTVISTGSESRIYPAGAEVSLSGYDPEAGYTYVSFGSYPQWIEGGDPDKVGRGCLAGQVPNQCIYQNHVFRVRLNKDAILPEFFARYILLPSTKQYFLECAKQTTGIATINKRQLSDLGVMYPPLNLQKRYLATAQQLDKSKHSAQKALEDLQATQKALIRKYLG